MTRERPIIMSDDSVRAILNGRKTQTRRVISLRNTDYYEDKKTNFNADITGAIKNSGILWTFGLEWLIGGVRYSDAATIKCPYGVPGGRLWVKEAWAYIGKEPETDTVYKADDCWSDKPGWKWRSPIFMPRWASRITLEILNIRVERVQEIGDDDAEAEGMMYFGETLLEPTPVDKYAELWDTLNAKRGYPWADNAWVWVIEFKVLP